MNQRTINKIEHPEIYLSFSSIRFSKVFILKTSKGTGFHFTFTFTELHIHSIAN